MRLETGEGAPSFAPPLPFAFLPRASASCGIFHPFRGENRITYARMKSATLTVPLALAAIGWIAAPPPAGAQRSEEHTSELQSRSDLVCRLLLEKKQSDLARRPPAGRGYGACV